MAGMSASPVRMCQCSHLPPTGQETGIDLGLEAFATLSTATIFSSRLLSQGGAGAQDGPTAGLPPQEGQQPAAEGGQAARQGASEGDAPTAGLPPQDGAAPRPAPTTRSITRTCRSATWSRITTSPSPFRDAGWAAFLSILSFKAACAGRSVIAVNPAFTSQTCSGCGVVVQKGLSVRWHSCPDCGTSLHRDHNAAKNIERLGQSLRGGVALAASENRESVGL